MASRRGQLLIASPRLRDPNFARTVVLIVKDDDDGGALGVILNRPLDVTVADAVREIVEAAEAVDEPVHQGGPCEGPLIVLHDNPAAGGEEIVTGVRFSMDKEDIEWLMEHHKGAIKYFAGYSGWGAGQLDAEIDEGAWLLTPATADHIFEKQGDWSKLSTWLALGKKIDIERIPDDPSVN
jgi:putative transcriptional regulator